MIAVDASALVSILTREPGFERLIEALAGSEAIIAPIGVFETVLAVARKSAVSVDVAKGDVQAAILQFNLRIEPTTGLQADIALEAHARFGKGRHPAALNMGDCFAYALAKAHGAALLFKGDDFVKTDIALAVESP
jgi:ribonuclease VapC